MMKKEGRLTGCDSGCLPWGMAGRIASPGTIYIILTCIRAMIAPRQNEKLNSPGVL
jgi:hypothetical protein